MSSLSQVRREAYRDGLVDATRVLARRPYPLTAGAEDRTCPVPLSVLAMLVPELEKLEWSGTGGTVLQLVDVCPWCGIRQIHGHEEECALDRTLSMARVAKQQPDLFGVG